MPRFDKYAFYERSVQTPERHIEMFVGIYRDLNHRYARRLREDFCGTFKLSCEWVKRNRRNEALSLDLDPEPLAYGKRRHYAKLTAAQKKRLSIRRADVRIVTSPRADMIIAGNFSFCIFKERATLVRYFRACLRSLAPGGLLILEHSGGPGMIEPMRERIPIFDGKGKRLYSYIWHQKEFDPLTHDAQYAIHFEMPGGKRYENAFTYDWRLWTLPELKDAMIEAGFGDVHFWWETTHRGRGTGEYARTKTGENAYAWIAYVVGHRT